MTELQIYDVRFCPGDSAFLIDDGNTAILYDTGFGFSGYNIADNIKRILGERKLDFIFLTHSHYDHALGSAYISERFPEAKIVAGEYAAKVFPRAGAQAVMRELDSKVASAYGVTDYEFKADRLRADITVSDNDTIKCGNMSFRVLNLPGHTRCSVAFYCEERKLLLSCETLGVYNGEETIIPSILVGYGDAVKSIERVEKLIINNILAPHYGLLNEEKTAYFLANMKRETVKAAGFIAERLKRDMSDKEIIDEYISTYRSSFTEKAYPKAAAELNTSIMIELIRKEFNL
ncbi:MAG: MBL fold metallo-hydrolase [Clostridia bacterium]|nr:MBL fold metallo-hydrolase [Clostridia bacterium]